MAVVDAPARVNRASWFMRLVAKAKFQSIASGLPIARGFARRDGDEIFDIVQGFVKSQVLFAAVELELFDRLLDGSKRVDELAFACSVSPDRLEILLHAMVSLGLVRRQRGGRYALARKGAAILGVPGLLDMIRHHDVLYRDLSDPVALLRKERETELAQFWPYVFGGGNVAPEVAERYSELMAQSQGLVAQDTLRQVSFKDVQHLLDVGGGTGAFLTAVARRRSAPKLTLMDLPQVMPSAKERLKREGVAERITLAGGSFRDDPLPDGADAISLIRVLYVLEDATVEALLIMVYDALPDCGRLGISEPITGSVRPEPSGDIYFAFYTMAMGTGKARSQARIAALCEAAGFEQIRCPKSSRPYVTSIVSARKSSN